jgi:excisionase family DNA binding protein
MEKDEFMTTAEAADILELELGSVSRLIRKGVLRGERFGPVWMVSRESVEAYLKKFGNLPKTDPRRGKSED